MIVLNQKFPVILSGKAKLADAAEAVILAQIASIKDLYGAAARFWDDAFQAQPALANDWKAGNRYNAACATALAGCGQGKDDPPLAAAKARWRKQAIGWLRAELAGWSKMIENGPPQAGQAAAGMLQHWLTDPDLAGIRDPDALKQLPEAERAACRALWADVAALVAKAQARTKP
ncbi:MAG: hypothetical protein ACP5XB_10065 [Isosphaeraceae bacterium]